MQITASAWTLSCSKPANACWRRRSPSKPNGNSANATTKAPCSLATRATTGAAPVPVRVQAGHDVAHSALGLVEDGHVAPDLAEALAHELDGAPARLLLVEAQHLPESPERRRVDAVGEDARVAFCADGLAGAGGHGAEVSLDGAVALCFRVHAGDEQAAVVVGPAGERFAPGEGKSKREAEQVAAKLALEVLNARTS